MVPVLQLLFPGLLTQRHQAVGALPQVIVQALLAPKSVPLSPTLVVKHALLDSLKLLERGLV